MRLIFAEYSAYLQTPFQPGTKMTVSPAAGTEERQ
jgi:hypothetical protein